MVAVWPTSLTITKEGFKESPPKRQLRSQMDVGPDKIRRRSSLAIRPVAIQLLLTDAQLATFDTFYDANDTAYFQIVHPRTGITHLASFSEESPSYEPNETLWNVSLSIELLP